MSRERFEDDEPEAPPEDIYKLIQPQTRFFTTGCVLLDCALGGGWAERRVINVVGDKSTGKTLIGIEALVNFRLKYSDASLHYIEAEAAFDDAYAQQLGMPMEQVARHEEIRTVEQLDAFLFRMMEEKDPSRPCLVIVDSLDAMSDEAELGRALTHETFGALKPKMMSGMFRRLIRPLAKTNTTLIIISQIRDKIGVTFGKKHSRAGGHALDFYASQAAWLAVTDRIQLQRNNVKRPVGVNVIATVEKNKVGPPFRTVGFPIYFSFGIEDVRAGISFLVQVKRTDVIGLTDANAKRLRAGLPALSDEEYAHERANVNAAVQLVWAEIEESFRPVRQKYAI